MAYRIISDSCADHPDRHGALAQVSRVPLTIRLGEDTLVDDDSLNPDALIERMKREPQAPTSACPSPGAFLEACGEDDTDVYMVAMSDKVSGSYSSAVVAADMIKTLKPGRNVHVFNTLSASAGQAAVCLKICELAAHALPFRQVVEQVEAFIASLTTLFVLEDLSVLKKAGRLSHLQALISMALRIKLVMGARPDGSIDVRGKALSMERALISLINMIKEKCAALIPGERSLVITHCGAPQRAEMIREAVERVCGFKEVLICSPSGISAMYANDGGVVVGF